MSYVALYRKWRPKSFDEVKGQEAVCRTLKNQIVNKRIGHAYLFCGTRGTGKTSVAKIMARAVNCTDSSDGNPCNACAVCKGILQESLMNVIEIDAASNNGVENIREIKEQVMYPPQSGRYKVYIIDEVHMLSSGAFNALLKTLEEPPKYVIFILATTELHKIPDTILSRCQRYDFKRIPSDVIFDRLRELCKEEHIAIEDSALELIVRRADGAMRDALSLLDECSAFYHEGQITYDLVLDILGIADMTFNHTLFQAILRRDVSAGLDCIEDLVAAGRELGQFVLDFVWYLRNALIIKTTAPSSEIVEVTKEARETIADLASQVSYEVLMRNIKALSELANRMKFSSQKRVLLEIELIRLLTPQMETNTDAVLDRISVLEQKISMGVGIIKIPAGDPKERKEEEKPQEKVVEISKADFEELQKLRKSWGHIVGSMSDSYTRTELQDTVLETDGEGNICVVFGTAQARDRVSRHSSMLIEEAVQKVMKKKYRIVLICREAREEREVRYVTKEELQDKIKMEIEITDEDHS